MATTLTLATETHPTTEVVMVTVEGDVGTTIVKAQSFRGDHLVTGSEIQSLIRHSTVVEEEAVAAVSIVLLPPLVMGVPEEGVLERAMSHLLVGPLGARSSLTPTGLLLPIMDLGVEDSCFSWML